MRVMQPLRDLGTPLADISQPMPFMAVQTAFDPLFPMGKLQSYWKAQNLDRLPDEAIDIIAARANGRARRRSRWWPPSRWAAPSTGSGRARPPTPNDRRHGCRRSTATGRTPPTTTPTSRGSGRASLIAPYSTGTTYTNFTGQLDEAAGALTAQAYGGNFARLSAIKAQYDPDNFFRLNPNIAPAALAGV
jgi:hypothetical protein